MSRGSQLKNLVTLLGVSALSVFGHDFKVLFDLLQLMLQFTVDLAFLKFIKLHLSHQALNF